MYYFVTRGWITHNGTELSESHAGSDRDRELSPNRPSLPVGSGVWDKQEKRGQQKEKGQLTGSARHANSPAQPVKDWGVGLGYIVAEQVQLEGMGVSFPKK